MAQFWILSICLRYLKSFLFCIIFLLLLLFALFGCFYIRNVLLFVSDARILVFDFTIPVFFYLFTRVSSLTLCALCIYCGTLVLVVFSILPLFSLHVFIFWVILFVCLFVCLFICLFVYFFILGYFCWFFIRCLKESFFVCICLFLLLVLLLYGLRYM